MAGSDSVLNPGRGALELDEFLFALREERYALVRFSGSFCYAPGADLDVLCADAPRATRVLLRTARRHLARGWEVEVHADERAGHVHVDLLDAGRLELRFDLHPRLPGYERFDLHADYFTHVLARRRPLERAWSSRSYRFFVPCELDDLALRWVEYLEYGEQRARKRKHLDHVRAAVRRRPDLVPALADRLAAFSPLSVQAIATRLSESLDPMDGATAPAVA